MRFRQAMRQQGLGRASPEEYLTLALRAHELLRDVPLYDVSIVDLPGGGIGRSVRDIRALEATAPPSRIAKVLYAVRRLLGRAFRWDDTPMRAEDSLVAQLSERDRHASEVVPGTLDGGFRTLYRFPNEALSEIRNRTVQGYLCVALSRTESGYRLYVAVYVLPVSWMTRPYLLLIEPFRRYLLYPAMLRRLRSAWIAAYGGTV
jgi:hypothetical protein